jgi:hypothetical protein
MTCTNCESTNSGTHYEHIQGATYHPFDVIPSPPQGPIAGIPQPQTCPINGCYGNPPAYPPVFSFCLDCGNIF